MFRVYPEACFRQDIELLTLREVDFRCARVPGVNAHRVAEGTDAAGLQVGLPKIRLPLYVPYNEDVHVYGVQKGDSLILEAYKCF